MADRVRMPKHKSGANWREQNRMGCSQVLIPEGGHRKHVQDQSQAGRWIGSTGISSTESGNEFTLRAYLTSMD